MIWCRTKLELLAALPFAARDDALLVAEDVVNARRGEVVKRYTAARSDVEYLGMLGLEAPAGLGAAPTGLGAAPTGLGAEQEASPVLLGVCSESPDACAPAALHRYEIVSSMTTAVFAFFDVDSPVPDGDGPGAGDHFGYVERTVRRDLAAHYGLDERSGAVALSQSHTPDKASVHAVVRFRTTMDDLALDVRSLRESSPIGRAYDDIYNRFRCFRAPGSSKHPGASRRVPRPALAPCACSAPELWMHVVRPLAGCGGPDLPALDPGCRAAVLRVRAASKSRAAPGWTTGAATEDKATGEDEAALVRAAAECGLARDLGVGRRFPALEFGRVSAAKTTSSGGVVVRGELAKRSFVCPGKNAAHASNRALLVYALDGATGARSVRYVCLDKQCRADNRDSVLERSLPPEPARTPGPEGLREAVAEPEHSSTKRLKV